MKTISIYTCFVFMLMSIAACQMRHFSSKNSLKKGLDGDLAKFQENSQKIASTYNPTVTDTSLSSKLRKFDRGYYVVKMKEVRPTLQEELDKIKNYAGKKVYSAAEKNNKKDDLRLTLYEVDNSLIPSFSDKLIYVIFLDNHRVLYHSPYLKNDIKLGNAGRVNFKNFPKRKNDTNLKRQKKYVRKTSDYFKLGDISYEYSSTMRGYYKITNDSIKMWFERGINKKKCIRLIRLDFTYQYDGRYHLINKISFKKAMMDNSYIPIDKTFNRDNIEFEYDAMPFKLLLKSNQISNSKTDSYIIQEITDSTDKRIYKVRVKGERNSKDIDEYLNNIYTF